MTPIPSFLACPGEDDTQSNEIVDFAVIDIPVEDGKIRRGALMFSSAGKARAYIATTPGVWHVICVGRSRLTSFFEDTAPLTFDCVAVDFLNSHQAQVVRCFDAYKAADALRLVDEDEVDPMPEVETWQAFM